MKSVKNILVAIADDHPILLDGLTSVLNEHPNIEVVIKAANGRELIEMLEKTTVDVVLMDLKMPEMDGLETTEYLQKHHPKVNIIGLSMLGETKFIIEMIKAGAHGFVSKGSTSKELIEAILKVMEHGFFFNQHMTETNYKDWLKETKEPISVNGVQLSQREIQVVQLVSSQMTNEQIANKLELSIRTVENYRYKILDKTGVNNTAGLVMFAIVNGIVKLDLSLKA